MIRGRDESGEVPKEELPTSTPMRVPTFADSRERTNTTTANIPLPSNPAGRPIIGKISSKGELESIHVISPEKANLMAMEQDEGNISYERVNSPNFGRLRGDRPPIAMDMDKSRHNAIVEEPSNKIGFSAIMDSSEGSLQIGEVGLFSPPGNRVIGEMSNKSMEKEDEGSPEVSLAKVHKDKDEEKKNDIYPLNPINTINTINARERFNSDESLAKIVGVFGEREGDSDESPDEKFLGDYSHLDNSQVPNIANISISMIKSANSSRSASPNLSGQRTSNRPEEVYIIYKYIYIYIYRSEWPEAIQSIKQLVQREISKQQGDSGTQKGARRARKTKSKRKSVRAKHQLI